MWRDKPGAWHEILPGVRRRILSHSASGMMVLYKIAPGSVFPWHNHTHAQFGIFLEGGGDFKVGERMWKISKGDSYFIPQGLYHEDGFKTPNRGHRFLHTRSRGLPQRSAAA